MRRLPVWPTLATVGNLLCGFAAIAAADAGRFEHAAYFVIGAMLFDAIDGRLARLTRTATEFGGQLDSLADVVSFGVAPAILMHNYVRTNLPVFPNQVVWAAAALYTVCAAMRLARFNVENKTADDAHKAFKGLPSPAAAGLLVTGIIFTTYVVDNFRPGFGVPFSKIMIGLLPVLAIAAAVLMVTRVRYPHLVSQLDMGDRPFSFLLLVIFIGMFVTLLPQIGLFLTFAVYVASGPVGFAIDQVVERLASDSEDGIF